LIPYPPLPEQQRIVTILDEAFGGIATAKWEGWKRSGRCLQGFNSIYTRLRV
jgi:type I restriction enzyme S subunit